MLAGPLRLLFLSLIRGVGSVNDWNASRVFLCKPGTFVWFPLAFDFVISWIGRSFGGVGLSIDWTNRHDLNFTFSIRIETTTKLCSN